MSRDDKEQWEAYKAQGLAIVTPLLQKLGYALDDAQPHVGGERFLMQAITTESGRKLILLGRRSSDGKRVVIKTTSDAGGIKELEHERTCRRILQEIRFAYVVFHSPAELFFKRIGGHLISIQEFVEQETTFLARPLEEQFSFALRAFKAQEGSHATTFEHERLVAKTFGRMQADDYLSAFAGFMRNILYDTHSGEQYDSLLRDALAVLTDNRDTIEQYCGFLTHTDFVPHNFRISGNNIYLLDHASLRFGNKYEGWARFLNFMTLYNRPLEDALETYVRENRTPEESHSLELMRIFRLGEILWYYTKTLARSDGDLLVLNTARARFWARALETRLAGESLPESVIAEYTQLRDRLRSTEEKQRQKDLH